MSRPASVRHVVLVAVVLAGGGLVTYLLWPAPDAAPVPVRGPDPSPDDPRLTFSTRFRNVHPDVAYVGDAACLPCHKDVCDDFHKHAMGRSARLAGAPADGLERFDAPAQPHFLAFGHDYRTERRGDTLVQTEAIQGPDGQRAIVTEAEVVAAIGSGTRGRSYLCARDGTLWQTGVSWFTEKQIWDASPGFAPGQHALRPVLPGCLFCHVNRVEPVPGTTNRYREPYFAGQAHIGCERCHGPGALHVADQADGRDPVDGFDDAIVNPKHLPANLREDVCRQCHFQGASRVVRRGREPFDFRPGLPLDLFVTVFARHPGLTDFHKSVGQVEQLSVSRCATAGERFGCTACHDPHRSPAQAERADYYRERCLACHQDQGCTETPVARKKANDACTDCHMAKAASTTIAHTAITDHRILRRPAPARTTKGALPAGELGLVALPGHGRHGPGREELDRDLGIALAAEDLTDAATRREAEWRLRAATERHAHDAVAWEALSRVLLASGEWSEALRAGEAAAAVDPAREIALGTAAEAALRARRLLPARDYARRALVVNPVDPENRRRLAQALSDTEDWPAAEAELRTVLKLFPNHGPARADLAVCLERQGHARAARAELERAIAIDPRQGPGLRAWFDRRTR